MKKLNYFSVIALFCLELVFSAEYIQGAEGIKQVYASEVTVNDEASLENAILNGDDIMLGEDIELTKKLVIDKDVSLYLNEKNLDTGGADIKVNADFIIAGEGSVDVNFIDVDSNGSVCIKDGSIINGKVEAYSGTVVMEGGEVWSVTVRDDAVMVFSDGKITGGGINIQGGELEMLGGTTTALYLGAGYACMKNGIITGSETNAVGIMSGIFEMQGGIIKENAVGGVHIWDSSTPDTKFIMTGGKIIDNDYTGIIARGGTVDIKNGIISGNNGYGARLSYGCIFSISQGVISDNADNGILASDENTVVNIIDSSIRGNKGAGVRIREGKCAIEDASIIDNIENEESTSDGGVNIGNAATIKIKGNVVIDNNKDYKGNPCNLKVRYGRDDLTDINEKWDANYTVEIFGELGNGTKIGVYGTDEEDFTKNFRKYCQSAAPDAFFYSDRAGYNVALNSSTGEVYLTKNNNSGIGKNTSGESRSFTGNNTGYENNSSSSTVSQNNIISGSRSSSSGSSSVVESDYSKGVSRVAGKGAFKAEYKKLSNTAVRYESSNVSSTAKVAAVPAVIKIDGKIYKVTSIAPKAFSDRKDLKSLVIGKNIKKIGENAVSGCKNLKVITLNTRGLVKKNVKNSLSGSSVNVIKVPANRVDYYGKIFTKANAGRKVSVKEK